jgi:hypothetical protein
MRPKRAEGRDVSRAEGKVELERVGGGSAGTTKRENPMTKMYQLLGADGVKYASPTKGLLGGNGKDKIYGRLDCRTANLAVAKGNTYQKHRIFFADVATAVASGYRPCGICLRNEYKSWRESQKSN